MKGMRCDLVPLYQAISGNRVDYQISGLKMASFKIAISSRIAVVEAGPGTPGGEPEDRSPSVAQNP
jgi:hypothetical protein